MGDIEGGIVQGGDMVSFRGRSLRVSTHIVAAAISSCEIPPSAPLCLYLSSDPSLLVELLSRPPLQMLCCLFVVSFPNPLAPGSGLADKTPLDSPI